MAIKPTTAKLEDDIRKRSGDPGVGGLLADPLDQSPAHETIDPEAGPASADPAPPVAHQDWSPNKRPKVRPS